MTDAQKQYSQDAFSQKKDSPAFRSKSYLEMASKWPYVSDVIKGTLHLRQLGQKYLPKFPAEDKDVYEDRRKTAVCFDATGKTRNGLVGLIFRKDPTLSEDTPQVIKDHLENVDLAGTHWAVFAKEVEEASVEYGHSFIFVDMQPEMEPGATHEDELKSGRRPYWIHYKADQAINWFTKQVNGQTVLEQITFEECTTEKDGRFGQKDVTRYRVLFLEAGAVKWELWRKDKDAGGKEEIALEDHGAFKNVTEIPLSVVYARKTGFLTSCPPLLNLAMLNLKHYQQQSEFDNTLHIVGYPMLCSDDADADETTVKAVGPALQVRVPKDCNVWYAEPDGSSLEHQAKNLETKKQEMAVMGISFLAERVNVEQTATEQVINHGERTSDLATMARSLKDALERSLGFHNQFLGGEAKAAGTAEMADPSELVLSSEDIRLLSDLVQRGQLDNETMWAMMLKAGRLPSNFEATLTSENIGKMQPTI